MKKESFKLFLQQNLSEKQDEVLQKFELFLELLLENNRSVNLVSRKTSADEFWTRHFLDSVLPMKFIDLNNKKILDFGTGGGIPGIPLKLIFPAASVYLLDSRRKKLEAVKKMIKKLDLSECFTIVSRLEEMAKRWNGFFDIVVCRSVKILPKYKKFLLKLLKDEGEIFLYKSRILVDTEVFSRKKVIDISHPELGVRKLIKIKKKWEGYE